MIISEENKNKKYWVYGYGDLGRNAYIKLKKLFGECMRGILVTKCIGSMKTAKLEGVPIFEFGEIELDESTVVFIATNPKFHESIFKTMKEHGFGGGVIYDESIDCEINERLQTIPLLETKLLAISVGQACNFKCRDCANFAPYAHQENMRYPVENIKRDLDCIVTRFSVIDVLHIQGGEPFLYSELAILLKYIETNFRETIKKVQIGTNGTIIPNADVLDILRRDWFEVRISNYGLSEQVNKLMSVLEENHVSYRNYNFIGKTGDWTDTGNIWYNSPPEEVLYEKVKNCGWCACYTIENGILGRCARSIPALSVQNVKPAAEDYLYVEKELSQEKISRYFMFIKPMECCRYCKGTSGEPIKAAIQLP